MGVLSVLFMTICTASYSFFNNFSQYWLKLWTENPVHPPQFYMGGFFLLTLLAFISTNGTMWSAHILIAVTSGVELHSRLLNSVARFGPCFWMPREQD